MKTKQILEKLIELSKTYTFVEITVIKQKDGHSYLASMQGLLVHIESEKDTFIVYKAGREDCKFNVKDVRCISAMQVVCGYTDCIDCED